MTNRAPFNCNDQTAASWTQRAVVAVNLIKNIELKNKHQLSVADIGCGDQKLRSALLAQGVDCHYCGYDLLPQSSEVTQFDVRSDALPHEHDVLVMLGVIEYLDALPGVLPSLSRQAPYLVVSHVIRKDDTYSPQKRAELGWLNHLSQDEIEQLLSASGYIVLDRQLDTEGKTMLFMCESAVYTQQ